MDIIIKHLFLTVITPHMFWLELVFCWEQPSVFTVRNFLWKDKETLKLLLCIYCNFDQNLLQTGTWIYNFVVCPIYAFENKVKTILSFKFIFRHALEILLISGLLSLRKFLCFHTSVTRINVFIKFVEMMSPHAHNYGGRNDRHILLTFSECC